MRSSEEENRGLCRAIGITVDGRKAAVESLEANIMMMEISDQICTQQVEVQFTPNGFKEKSFLNSTFLFCAFVSPLVCDGYGTL